LLSKWTIGLESRPSRANSSEGKNLLNQEPSKGVRSDRGIHKFRMGRGNSRGGWFSSARKSAVTSGLEKKAITQKRGGIRVTYHLVVDAARRRCSEDFKGQKGKVSIR